MKNHTVTWNTEFDSEVTLVVDKSDNLIPYELIVTIRQQINNSNNYDDIGTLAINLSEHANENVHQTSALLLKGDDKEIPVARSQS